MLIVLLTTIFILGRAYFYFIGNYAFMNLLEFIFIIIFTILILIKREHIYFAIFSFLPSTVIYFILLGKPISDLLIVSYFLTIYVLFYKKYQISYRLKSPIKYIYYVYIILFLILLINISLALLSGTYDVYKGIHILKYVNYILLPLYSGYLFFLVYNKRDNHVFFKSLLVIIILYLVSSSIGYGFPGNLDIYKEGFLWKSFFRYPGLSSSNYIGNIILLLIVIAYSVKYKFTPLYIILILVTSFLSQSRSVFLIGLLLVLYFIRPKFENAKEYIRLIFVSTISVILLIITLLSLVKFNNISADLYSQFINRILLKTGIENIYERLLLCEEAINIIYSNPVNLLIGYGYFERGTNPHNLFLEALLLFGFLGAIILFILFFYLLLKFPIILFVLIASQFEILFFTGTYDFLFFILIISLIKNKREFYNSIKNKTILESQ